MYDLSWSSQGEREKSAQESPFLMWSDHKAKQIHFETKNDTPLIKCKVI